MKTGMSPEYWEKVIKATQAPWDPETQNRINDLDWEQYFKLQDYHKRKNGWDTAGEETKKFFAELENIEIINGIRPIPYERRHEFLTQLK